MTSVLAERLTAANRCESPAAHGGLNGGRDGSRTNRRRLGRTVGSMPAQRFRVPSSTRLWTPAAQRPATPAFACVGRCVCQRRRATQPLHTRSCDTQRTNATLRLYSECKQAASLFSARMRVYKTTRTVFVINNLLIMIPIFVLFCGDFRILKIHIFLYNHHYNQYNVFPINLLIHTIASFCGDFRIVV